MSGTYRARGGEGWSDVARNTTGDDLDAAKIAKANPGVPIPIPVGTTIQIPIDPTEVVVGISGELALEVNQVPIGTFDDFELAMAVDAIWKCGFTVPNEPETRALFVPMASPEVTVDSNGTRLFTGRAESPQPANEPTSRSLGIACYSTPGILERVTPPLAAFPLEYTNANLVAIANDLCAFHGVSVDFQADAGATFDRVDIQPNEDILSFLAGLAAQRGPVITSNTAGQLVFWNGGETGAPIARYEKGYAPALSVSVAIDESQYYSKVSGFIPAKSKKESAGKQFTVENPFATDLVRPYSFEAKDISPGELETSVNTAAGRMFASIFSATLELPTWYTEYGVLFTPNQTIELKSPDDFINDFYEFLITGVSLSKVSNEYRATLELSLPGIFSGEIPERMPWQ